MSVDDVANYALDLQTLRIVQAIADTGTITGAAKHLGYSQPAVSQHLRKLESRLDLPIIDRVGRSVRLTEAGRVIARHAITINSAVKAVSEELAELSGMRTGQVRIAAFPTASSTIVPAILLELADRYPGIAASYVEAEPPEAVEMLRNGTVDVVLTFSYTGNHDDPHRASTTGLAVATVFEDEIMLALPESRWGPDAQLSLDQLSEEKWITGCERCKQHLLEVCEDVGFIATAPLQTENYAALLAMVGGGLGVGLVSRLALSGVPIPDGVFLRRFPPIGPRRIHLVTSPTARHVPSIAATLNVIFELGGERWGMTVPN